MAISGEYIWNLPPTLPSSATTPATTDWKALVATRWAEMLGYTPKTLMPLLASITVPTSSSALTGSTDAEKLLRPGYYPKIDTSGPSPKVVVMADGMFPNIINHRGEFRSPDGVLGLPEQNEFGGGDASNSVIPITDPAI